MHISNTEAEELVQLLTTANQKSTELRYIVGFENTTPSEKCTYGIHPMFVHAGVSRLNRVKTPVHISDRKTNR